MLEWTRFCWHAATNDSDPAEPIFPNLTKGMVTEGPISSATLRRSHLLLLSPAGLRVAICLRSSGPRPVRGESFPSPLQPPGPDGHPSPTPRKSPEFPPPQRTLPIRAQHLGCQRDHPHRRYPHLLARTMGPESSSLSELGKKRGIWNLLSCSRNFTKLINLFLVHRVL